MKTRMQDVRPPTAIVVLAAALVAALMGTALAGGGATTKVALNKKAIKRIAAKQAERAIDRALPLGGDALASGAVSRDKVASRAIGPAALGEVVVRRARKPLLEGSNAIPEARCLPGERLITGGGSTNRSLAFDIAMISSGPTDGAGRAVLDDQPVPDPGGWSVEFVNAPGGVGDSVATAEALCLR